MRLLGMILRVVCCDYSCYDVIIEEYFVVVIVVLLLLVILLCSCY
jgi:hypothetical protein